MTPEQQQEQHDTILLMSKDIKIIANTIKKLPCKDHAETITRHDEKIKTLWLPFGACITVAVAILGKWLFFK